MNILPPSFTKNRTYYRGEVYEFNLPAGHSCPFARECRVVADRLTGKMSAHSGAFRCYAASAERFPAVRAHRWRNMDAARGGILPSLPKGAKHVRIHASGDFFSQRYFDQWLDYAMAHPQVEFWAFTKSIPFWVNRLGEIPKNLTLTASHGGYHDALIEGYHLKSARVYANLYDVPRGLMVDTNDNLARVPRVSFALLDNFRNPKKKPLTPADILGCR